MNMPSYLPLLAVITGILETVGAVWAMAGRGRRTILVPIAFIFALLAGYQFAEAAVCARPANLLFSRLAFLDITWLPPAGLWLVFRLTSGRSRWRIALPLFYSAAALAVSVWIALDPSCITQSVCRMVLAVFRHAPVFEYVFGIFYQSAMFVLIAWPSIELARAGDPLIRKHLASVQLGVLGFVLPSLYLRIMMREPEGLLPSVMCHFAVTLALGLAVSVARERAAANAADGSRAG